MGRFASLIAAIFLATAPAADRVESPAITTVVLVTIDTLRADHLGSYGYPRGVSPFLDQLATRSVVFERHISSSSHTAPSHASLFTSLYPCQHRVLNNGQRLDTAATTLADLAGDAGFHTAGFPAVGFLEGLRNGFEYFDACDGFRPAEDVLRPALRWLQRRRPSERVFLWVHLFDVHEWYVDRNLDTATLARLIEHNTLNGSALEQFLARSHGVDLESYSSRKPITDVVNRYDAQLQRTDAALGRFFDQVSSLQRTGTTLWIVTSDHGEGLGNHDFLGHGGRLYEEQLHVPLLIHSSDGRFEPHRVTDLVRQVDVAPTIAELMGARFPDHPVPPRGHSLVPLIQGTGTAAWKSTFAFSERRPPTATDPAHPPVQHDVFSVRTPTEKFILATNGTCERYDLVHDPHELVDLLAAPCSKDPSYTHFFKKYQLLKQQGGAFRRSPVDPKHEAELRALGYL